MRNQQRNISLHILKLCAFMPLFLFYSHASAQLQRYALPKKTSATHASLKGSTQKNSTARIQQDTVILTLPFWDDFSTTTTDYPDTNRWINSRSVWINNGMGINEPSINVATFDGLDSTNLAYNPNQTLVNSITDKLISQPINMSTVPADHRDSVYFSFFYQWQGNGEAPDKIDYLTLEFKDKDSVWNTMTTIYQRANPDPTIFYDTIIKITDDKYFHNNFQFRFLRFGRASGPFDTWNVDYIYLNDNRTGGLSHPDQAAASEISPLFGDYYAIPLKHFFSTKKLDSVRFDIQNLKDGLGSVNYTSTITFKKNYNDTIPPAVYEKVLAKTYGIRNKTNLIFPFERVRQKLNILPDPNDPLQFDSLATSIHIKLKMQVISNDSTSNLHTTGEDKYLPFNLHVNDTVSTFYNLNNYYAYDDGVAEYSAGLTQSGNLLAYQFTMATTKSDTLVGFDAYFPDFALAADQTADFYIYKDNGSGVPGTPALILPRKSITPTGKLNGFTSILFVPAIKMEGTFYIGWKEPQTGHIRVGLDTSHDTGDKMFVNVTNSWVPNDVVHGSFMIRPVFGTAGSVIAGIPVAVEKNPIQLYPNPNNGTFFINGQYDHLNVFSITGQQIGYTAEETGDDRKITLQAAPGLYIIKLYNGKNSESKKIVVR